LMTARCGTADYVSPDVLFGEGYTEKADLWSLGVIVWMLLTGYPPFHGSKESIMAQIKAGRPDWSHTCCWDEVSLDAIDFVKKLLVVDPQKRLDAEAAIQHPWLAQPAQNTACSRPLVATQTYAASTKAYKAALQVLLQQLDWQARQELRQEMLSMGDACEESVSSRSFHTLLRHLEQTDAKHAFPQARADLLAELEANGAQQTCCPSLAAELASKCQRSHRYALWCQWFADFAVVICGGYKPP